MKSLHGICFALVLFATSFLIAHAAELSASEKYQDGKVVNILIVPGHDDQFSGTEFAGVREADMALALAKKIRDDLAMNSNISVTLAREGGMYIPELTTYFEKGRRGIESFIKKHKRETNDAIDDGDIEVASQVPHANANADVAMRLYGINKWADEQDFDLVLHVHFNDFAGRVSNAGGEYGGFTVYTPDAQLPNGNAAKPFASALGKRLSSVFPRSTMPLESNFSDEFGVVPDFKLIAIGANRTLEIPSILIEYAYIYEPHVSQLFFANTSDVYARATATGLLDYLSGISSPAKNVVYHFDTDLLSSQNQKSDALMLQLALSELGLYPPVGKTNKDCPFTGRFGPCTKSAVTAFQKKYYLDADGLFGKRTRASMNGFFGL